METSAYSWQLSQRLKLRKDNLFKKKNKRKIQQWLPQCSQEYCDDGQQFLHLRYTKDPDKVQHYFSYTDISFFYFSLL